MAKKKKAEDDLEDLDDLEDFDEEEEIEGIYPSLGKDAGKSATETVGEESDELEEELAEEFEVPLMEEEEVIDYDYLKLELKKPDNEEDYELLVHGQSHGFCNIFVKKLLNIEGVDMAAYKITKIYPPQVFIRLLDGYKIKDILRQGIADLREEVLEVQEAFQKLL